MPDGRESLRNGPGRGGPKKKAQLQVPPKQHCEDRMGGGAEKGKSLRMIWVKNSIKAPAGTKLWDEEKDGNREGYGFYESCQNHALRFCGNIF